MATNAELRAAATYFATHDGCTCDPESGVMNCMGCYVAMMARHILAIVTADDDEPPTVESLRQQLAEVTAECRRLEHDVEVAHAHRRIANDESYRLRAERDAWPNDMRTCAELSCDECNERANGMRLEIDRLRAELLQQPPTLEWLRATFGGQPEVTAGSTGYNVYRWSCGVKYHDPHGQVSCPPGVLKRTRAAVLEAVAATKENANG